MKKGFEVFYVTREQAHKFQPILMRANQVWIFDDYNDAEHHFMKPLFLKALLNVQQNGGLILVTSNQNKEYIFEKACSETIDLELDQEFKHYGRTAIQLFGLRQGEITCKMTSVGVKLSEHQCTMFKEDGKLSRLSTLRSLAP